MKNLFSNWLKRQTGVIDESGTNRLNYLLMKADYLSEKVQALELEKKQLMNDIISLQNSQSDYEVELGDIDRKVENVSSDVENGNFNYIWEKLDDVCSDVEGLEIPTGEDIRDIIQQETEDLYAEKDLRTPEDENETDSIRTMVVNIINDVIEHRIRTHSNSVWTKIDELVKDVLDKEAQV